MALYDDIGGAPAVRAVLDAFYSRLLADAVLSPFFLGVDVEQLKKTEEGFFARALGGPDAYAGRRLEDAHRRTRQRGLNGAAFDHFVTVFTRVLADRSMTDTQIAAWLLVIEAARANILDR